MWQPSPSEIMTNFELISMTLHFSGTNHPQTKQKHHTLQRLVRALRKENITEGNAGCLTCSVQYQKEIDTTNLSDKRPSSPVSVNYCLHVRLLRSTWAFLTEFIYIYTMENFYSIIFHAFVLLLWYQSWLSVLWLMDTLSLSSLKCIHTAEVTHTVSVVTVCLMWI